MDTLIEQGQKLFQDDISQAKDGGPCPLPYTKQDGTYVQLFCDCPKTKTYLTTQLIDSFPSCSPTVKCPVRQYLFESK